MNRTKTRKITKNKTLETQLIFNEPVTIGIEWFVFNLETKSNCDHAGIFFNFELFKQIYFSISIYDIRHKDE